MGINETYLGLLLLLILIVFIFAYKRLTKNPDALTSKFETKKIINGNPTENLQLIKEALKNAGFKKVGLDNEENCFYAQTKLSLYSFSENIVVTFKNDHFSTELNFKSICALPTQIIDWGKNKRNYKKFERELGKLMPITKHSDRTQSGV